MCPDWNLNIPINLFMFATDVHVNKTLIQRQDCASACDREQHYEP